MKTDSNYKIAIRIKSENSDYFQETLDTVRDGKRNYLNSFADNQNQVKSFLLSENLEKSYPVNFSETIKSDGKRVFNGFLERGKCSELGINFRLTITEIYQPDSKQFCYAHTVHFYRRPDSKSFLEKLFAEPEPVKAVQSKGKKK